MNQSNISHNQWAIVKEDIEENWVKMENDGGRRLKKKWFQQPFWKNSLQGSPPLRRPEWRIVKSFRGEAWQERRRWRSGGGGGGGRRRKKLGEVGRCHRI